MLWRMFGALCLTLFAARLPAIAFAATPTPVALTLRPQGTADIKVFSFCLDHAKTFPKGDIRPAGVADPKLRSALAYAVDKGYDQTEYFQTQLAIWYLVDNQWYDANHAIAQEIVDAVNSNRAPATSFNEPGAALGQALANGQVDAVIQDLNNLNGTDYFGIGTLKVVNKSNANVSLYVPFGTVFPATAPQYQGAIVYATEVQRADTATTTSAGSAGGPNPFLLLVAISAAGVMLIGASYAVRSR